jgi:hypothetical protein
MALPAARRWCAVRTKVAVAVSLFWLLLLVSSSWPDAAGAAERRDDVVCEGTADLASTPEPSPGGGLQGVPGSVPSLPTVVQTRGEAVRAFAVDVEVGEDGSAVFTETIDYDFDGRPDRHGIFRRLYLTQRCNDEWDRVYPLSVLDVTSPTGAPADWVVEDGPDGTTQIRIGDADRTVRGRHTYRLRYRLQGVVNAFPGHQELYWNVTGDGWDVPLYDVTVAVHAPAPAFRLACYAGRRGSTATCDAGELAGDRAGFQQQQLMPGEGLTVAVALPAGAVADAPLLLERRWSLARAFSVTPLTVGGSAVLLAALLAGVAALAFGVGRDRRLAGSPTDVAFAPAGADGVPVPLFERGDSPVEFVPPDGVRPAQLALVRNESVRPLDISATIVDLAVRGALRIEQVGEGRRSDYRLVRLRDDDPDWVDYERTLMNALFTGRNTVLLSELRDRFAKRLGNVIDQVYDNGISRGWFAARPDRVRVRWRALGILLTVVSAAVLAAAAAFTTLALLTVPLLVASLAIVLFAGRFPRRTPAGTGLRRRIGGFEHFMVDSEAPRARWAEQRSIFSDYLGYAVVLGITDRWARTFAPLGVEATAATSAWYVGNQPFTVERLNVVTTSFTTAASRTLASTPPPSSGGSGFSGGGSAGGGGGGGGGGSW